MISEEYVDCKRCGSSLDLEYKEWYEYGEAWGGSYKELCSEMIPVKCDCGAYYECPEEFEGTGIWQALEDYELDEDQYLVDEDGHFLSFYDFEDASDELAYFIFGKRPKDYKFIEIEKEFKR